MRGRIFLISINLAVTLIQFVLQGWPDYDQGNMRVCYTMLHCAKIKYCIFTYISQIGYFLQIYLEIVFVSCNG